MGSYDGVEVCELVGLFILNDLCNEYGKDNIGVVNFLDFACTCAGSNSQLSSIRISFFGFNFSMASHLLQFLS